MPETNQKIDVSHVYSIVNENLINKIFSDSMLCRENVITSPAGQEVVPKNYLDYKANLPAFNIGSSRAKTDAKYVYDALVELTYWLLKVGTYSYNEYRNCSGVGVSSDSQWSKSGTALFTDEYTSSNIGNRVVSPTPSDAGVIKTGLLTVANLKTLSTNCVSSWKSSKRPTYNKTYTFCHNSCHSNCHSSCHSSCHDNCHGFECHANGPGYNNAGHGGYKSNS